MPLSLPFQPRNANPGVIHSACAPDEDRIVTIPNVISVVRLACVPLFLWLLFGHDDRLAAAWLLAVLGATDWVDGYIARHFNQVSNAGQGPRPDRRPHHAGGGRRRPA